MSKHIMKSLLGVHNMYRSSIVLLWLFSCICTSFLRVSAQNTAVAPSTDLLYKFNPDGTHFAQITFLNQTWIRFNENLPGTVINGDASNESVDIGLRRTRIQMIMKPYDDVFLYFQFGQNNYNSEYNATGNRKQAAFFHDAVCEYVPNGDNTLKLGAGLTIANGLSRFSQPSISSILTLDVPVFAQTTVDQTDLFSRKLSVYARGQIGKFDYRFSLSDPFPITSNGYVQPTIGKHALFSSSKPSMQQQGYVIYQLFDHEQHLTPYMTGTYLGKRKIANIAIGAIHQDKATWTGTPGIDTTYHPMNLLCIESFIDMPVDESTGTAISGYAGMFKTDYGPGYLRYNGIMNPATGQSNVQLAKDAGPQFGNAYPMFGTGNVIYLQCGYLLPREFLGLQGQLLPYASLISAQYERLGVDWNNTINIGLSWLLHQHKAKFTLDYMNRPGMLILPDQIQTSSRKQSLTVQYQLFI
ncbi:hypothetical protein EBV26_08440 [bacterium]|nr:hypothetical protein [bacterium]